MSKHSEVEYVYNFGSEFEFRKVLVEIYVEETQVLLNVVPDSMVTAEELDKMLKGFQDDVLGKMRFNIRTDCAAQVSFGGKKFGVEFTGGESEGAPLVKRIIPA